MKSEAKAMEPPTLAPSREEADLQAYHDGELRGFARWRLERRLARSPELRQELALLGRVADWVREADDGVEVDLWDQIALRLPAEDARREAGEGLEDLALPVSSGWPSLGALLGPAAAVAVALVTALALLQGVAPAPERGGKVVRWVDSGTRSVLIDDRVGSDVTVIWMLDRPA